MSLKQTDPYENKPTNVITEELLRKRSEHNDGQLSTLEEITLHQYNLIEISPILHEKCRMLKILYLQNNLIEKIENLHHLKSLQYLNMAVNSVQEIENLESLESLQKLDLTVNFIGKLSSVKRLAANYNLKELFLLGNPCCVFKHYRLYVIQHVPQLEKLDGKEISTSERILSNQIKSEIESTISKEESDWIQQQSNNIDDNEEKYNDKGEKLYGNDPKSRKKAAEDLLKQEDELGYNRDKTVDASKIGELERLGKSKSIKRLTPEEEIEKYGHVLQFNEGKWDFKMFDDEKGNIIVEVPVGKFLSTASIDVDVQPTYCRINIKGKILQLRFESEVDSDRANAQRNKTNGNLKLTLPKSGKVDRVSKNDIFIPSIVSEVKSKQKTIPNPNNEVNIKDQNKPINSLKDEDIGSKIDYSKITK